MAPKTFAVDDPTEAGAPKTVEVAEPVTPTEAPNAEVAAGAPNTDDVVDAVATAPKTDVVFVEVAGDPKREVDALGAPKTFVADAPKRLEEAGEDPNMLEEEVVPPAAAGPTKREEVEVEAPKGLPADVVAVEPKT